MKKEDRNRISLANTTQHMSKNRHAMYPMQIAIMKIDRNFISPRDKKQIFQESDSCNFYTPDIEKRIDNYIATLRIRLKNIMLYMQ